MRAESSVDAPVRICQPRASSRRISRFKRVRVEVQRIRPRGSLAARADGTPPSSATLTAPALSSGSSGNLRVVDLELIQVSVGQVAGHRQRRVDADLQIAGASRARVNREVLRAVGDILDARDAVALRRGDRGAQRALAIAGGRRRHETLDQGHRRSFQEAGRFTRSCIVHDRALRGCGCLAA